VTADGDIVVISPDGTIWDLPAGRPKAVEPSAGCGNWWN
jgi:hypothetical protein